MLAPLRGHLGGVAEQRHVIGLGEQQEEGGVVLGALQGSLKCHGAGAPVALARGERNAVGLAVARLGPAVCILPAGSTWR